MCSYVTIILPANVYIAVYQTTSYLFVMKNGFSLYKDYLSASQTAKRGSFDWQYGQLLTEAFYLVGVRKLFDLLEQADETGQQIELVYAPNDGLTVPVAFDIRLTDATSEVPAFRYQ